MSFFRSIAVYALAALPVAGAAQISFSTAMDMALRSNPQVQLAEADVQRARAAVSEARDAYVPTLIGGSGLGESYGFPIGQPTLFNVASQSLLFNFSQHDYIRAARFSLTAANLSLADARQAAAEDAAVTYISLDRDIRRMETLQQELTFANRLVDIVQQRIDAGQDNALALTTAKLTAAQIKLALLHAQDDEEMDQAHLGRLMALPPRGLTTVSESIPTFPPLTSASAPEVATNTPSVDSAYANARSKQQLARGDAHYLYRPQIAFVAQYSLFSTFNNYQVYYNNFQQNNAAAGIQLTLPVVDVVHRAKARESAADAVHAQRQADIFRDQELDGRLKARHATAELMAKADVATLEQQIAQQQLDVLLVELQNGSGNGASPPSPKDEMSSRIAEREKQLALLDLSFQVKQAQLNLLRQMGDLEAWLKSAVGQTSLSATKP